MSLSSADAITTAMSGSRLRGAREDQGLQDGGCPRCNCDCNNACWGHEQAHSNTPRSCSSLCARPPGGRVGRKPVKYVGKTSGGHKVTFKLYGNKKIDDFETGIPTTCIPIQGGGAPMTGVDVWPNSWFLVNRTAKFQAMLTPAFYWKEVTNEGQRSRPRS